MNKRWSLCVGMVLSLCTLIAADEPNAGSFVSQLIPPELIVQHREAIKLSNEQLQRIRDHGETGGGEAAKLQEAIQTASQKMSRILGSDEIDESAALQQLDTFLDAERRIKQIHLRAMIRVRNELTVEQRRMLATLQNTQRQAPAPNNLERRLRDKLTKIQREVERRVRSGVPPMEAARMMEGFQQQMEAGRPQQAEAILDGVLKMLNISTEPTQDNEKTDPDQQSNRQAAPREALSKVPVMQPLSQAAVQQAIIAFEKPEVAWRKIAWETCLLDGLKKSRDEGKPIILWVFIDRPIDDERC